MFDYEEKQKIFSALEEYRKKHNADYYCLILTPPEGQKVNIPGNVEEWSAKGGEYGLVVEGIVERELLRKEIKR